MVSRAHGAQAWTPDLGTDRFSIHGELGNGAYGRVFEAFDHERQHRVAVKVLTALHGDALASFKREFRAMQDVRHPNLARLHGLYEHDGQWFFSMELVDGVDLREYIRTGTQQQWAYDEVRLRSAALQLANVLAAVHEQGLVHRDVKPSNVRVTANGRLALLDFGLVSDGRHARSMVGTPAYMAPEQAMSGQAITGASDWYAFGCVVYEALCGELPYRGTEISVLVDKASHLPQPPSELANAVAPDLEAIALALIQPDPSDRLSEEDVLAKVRAARGSTESLPTAGHADSATGHHFVGRSMEMQQLEQARQQAEGGKCAVAVVQGDSGVGKTALVNAFCSELPAHAVVIRGRCSENELVPFNALDGAVDAMSEALSLLDDAECQALLPARASCLLDLFGVLSQVPSIAEGSDYPAEADPTVRRNSAFRAFVELMKSFAQRFRPVVILEDVQWADEESLALLGDLLKPPGLPPMLLLVVLRSDEETPAAVRAACSRWQQAADVGLNVALQELDEVSSRELADQLLPHLQEDSRQALASAVQGHPLLLELLALQPPDLAQTARASVDETLMAVVNSASHGARKVLQTLCTAGAPMRHATALCACDVPPEAFSDAVGELRARKLVRNRRLGAFDGLEPYHGRIRRAVVASQSPDQQTALHQGVAEALAHDDAVDHELLAGHWERAGQPDRAGEAACRAARVAESALAFDKAARLYRWARELSGDGADAFDLCMSEAAMLARGGQASKAAGVYAKAQQRVPEERRDEVAALVALNLIRGGRIEEGLAASREVVATMGIDLPLSERSALVGTSLQYMRRMLGGNRFRLREAREIRARELWEVDTLYLLGSSLSLPSLNHAFLLHMHHVRTAFRVGDASRVARALAMDASGMYYMGQAGKIPAQLERARELTQGERQPEVVAECRFAEALVEQLLGHSEQVVTLCKEAEGLFARTVTDRGWVASTMKILRMLATLRSARMGEFMDETPALMVESHRSGEPYLWHQAQLYLAPTYYLARDETGLARDAIDDSESLIARLNTSTNAWYWLAARLRADVYGAHDSAFERFLERWRWLQDTGVLRAPNIALEALPVHAMVTLATCDDRALPKVLRRVERLERKLTRRDGAHQAALLAASRALRQGDCALASEGFQRAARDCGKAQDHLSALAAQYMAGALQPGTPRDERTDIERGLARHGVVDPQRFVGCLLPGVWTLADRFTSKTSS